MLETKKMMRVECVSCGTVGHFDMAKEGWLHDKFMHVPQFKCATCKNECFQKISNESFERTEDAYRE
jgi:hypothetical protein